jgi:1,2-diacylglycerol 3-alpha-glucosyltransferase
MSSEMQRLAVIWHRFGPYHVARLRGAAAVGRGHLLGIELSAHDDTYRWSRTDSADSFERVTVFDDRDCDTVAPKEVSRRLWLTLDSLCPDVVCIPSWGANYAASALAWCMRTSTPTVVMLASSRGDKVRAPWKEGTKALVARQFQAGIVGGSRQAQYLAQLGVSRQRIWPGYDVVDNRHFACSSSLPPGEADRLRRKLGLPPKFFISVSRFIAKKNVPVILEGFARFRETGGREAREWHLVLLGDGPLRGRYEQRVAELGLRGAVRMPGFKQYDELPLYYGLAGAFVLGSTEEQWGLVVNEAMAAGLPVLVSERCGCAPDLVREGESGFTFHPHDAGALAGLMARLAANPDERDRMGQAARRTIAEWSPETFGRNLWQAAEAAAALPRPRHTLASRLLLPALSRRKNRRDE